MPATASSRNSSGCARWSAESGRDVDRHVADQPHAALVRVRAQRAPLALEAHLVGDRAAAGEARPVLDPARLALAEVELLGAADRRGRLGQQPRPGGERRARLVRRAIAVGRPERQHLPPRLAGVGEPVHPRVGVAAQAPARQRGGMELHAGRAGEVHGAQLIGFRLHALADRLRRGAAAGGRLRFGDVTPGYSRPRCRHRRPGSTSSTREPVVDARPLPREAHGRRPRRGHRRRVPRRPREAARRRRRTAAPAGPSGARPSCTRSTRTINGVRWGGSFVVDRVRPLGVHDRGLDRRLRHLARRAAAQARGRPARARERAERGRRAAAGRRRARRGRRPQADRARAARPGGRRDPRGGQARRRARQRALRRGRAQRRAPRRSRGSSRRSALEVDRVRARFGSWYELFPRSWGGLKGVQEQLPALAELGFDVLYMTPIHPIGRTNRKGRNNTLDRRRRRPRLALRGRRRGGRPRRGPPGHRHGRGRPRAVRRRRGARHGRRAWTSRSTPRPTTRG